MPNLPSLWNPDQLVSFTSRYRPQSRRRRSLPRHHVHCTWAGCVDSSMEDLQQDCLGQQSLQLFVTHVALLSQPNAMSIRVCEPPLIKPVCCDHAANPRIQAAGADADALNDCYMHAVRYANRCCLCLITQRATNALSR